VTTILRDTARTDVQRLLQHTSAVLARYADLDEKRTEQALDTFAGAVAQIAEETARYHEPYRLAIVGDFKVGKSSLVNAFLGHKNLVAEGVAPTTGAVTELQFGETASGTVYDAAGNPIFHGDPLQAAKYADQRQPEGRAHSGKGVRVVLSHPAKVLQKLTIVDTPGLGASALDDAVTLGWLHKADAALLVMHATRVGGESPVAMAERLATTNKRVTLVITQADRDPAKAGASAAAMEEVFRDVIDGPPIVFSSKRVEAALELAAAAAADRDEERTQQARAALVEWGHAALTERVVNGHLSSTGSAGAARARAALGELRKRCKALAISSAREQDAAARRVAELTTALDETERVVAEVLDAKLPYLEDRIEDVVDQYVAKLLDTLREAVEIFVDEKMDAGVVEGLKAFWANFDDAYDTRRRNELERSFRKLFPPALPEIAGQDIERAVNRLLTAEWKAVVREVGGKTVSAGVGVDDLMKKIDEHLQKVLAAIALQIASLVALIFVPGGWVANVFELAGSSALAQGQMSKTDARAALVKRRAGHEIRTQRTTITSRLAAEYRDLNRSVHAAVVEKTRASSGAQRTARDAAAAARLRWQEASRDLAAILAAVADAEQGGV
jgi:tRNA U34 5-carboxymethylaminomethyl modifying GTPase MnmE/TrmE